MPEHDLPEEIRYKDSNKDEKGNVILGVLWLKMVHGLCCKQIKVRLKDSGYAISSRTIYRILKRNA